MLRLLCITAHPDDEAGGFGGTLLRYATAGVETSVVCLTPGQAASHRGGAKSDDELSQMRRKEFDASCELLQVRRGEVMNFRDGALDRENFLQVTGELVQRIRSICPQVVITLGPEGSITAHPDHSMAGIFATMAFQWAGRSDRFTEQMHNGLGPHRAQKLYYSTSNFFLEGRQPIAPAPITARIQVKEFLPTRIAAFRRHTTQTPLFELFEKNVARRGEYELYHLAAAASPGPAREETDLFEGIREN